MKHYKTAQVDIDLLKPYKNNARTHSSEQIKQIMDSIKEFGFTNPLLIDSDFNLIAGHGRLEALKQLNTIDFKDNPIEQVPCVVIDGLSEEQKRALVIADNKIAENAGWDFDLLKQEIKDLDDLAFPIDLLGFDIEELGDMLIGKEDIWQTRAEEVASLTRPNGTFIKFKRYKLELTEEEEDIFTEWILKHKEKSGGILFFVKDFLCNLNK